ncbi:superoxide dismutase [Mycolicibacterium neoaurum]|uniref:superoxide dismutase n=1 Tax=Mycolicibacterium neoaurum TaxID=1795 RepID=UPI00248B8CCB|nr:superoxide dismutase [Mycolicibacterium neoaurum]WBP92729.1 superoxide dismutase [Mycolicibacterium neoaurum]WBS06291.1 superoxide dismutase [Mycolicibacterium neoaurum]
MPRRIPFLIATLTLALLGVSATHLPPQAAAQTAFSLPVLPYAPGALEPVIDAQTMVLHHNKHHQSYVDALNAAVAADPAAQSMTLEQLVAAAGTMPAAIRNNAGGHWNHTFFWTSMAAPGQGGQPSSALQQAIDRQFGSLDAMKTAFNEAGTKRFGSGWAWLIVEPNGRLTVTSTPNQDNPLMDIADVKGTPLLGNDVWEHAYYLKHQNRRGEYLADWWQVVNWNTVSDRYAALVS